MQTQTQITQEKEPKIVQVQEFQYLLEKSQQLFAGLRDLAPTGRNWQPYFQRTFEVYTKLWKFQQTNRTILENKDFYGLNRWEIGEIASKIGQLYYHYYLRTSETNYLFESFIFYDAIRERAYFRDVADAKSPSLMIKKLRYYARYIVVCLLLNRTDMVRKLMDELTGLVEEYTKQFKPNDSAEWNVVLSEISTFLEAEKKLSPVDLEGNILTVPSRLDSLSNHFISNQEIQGKLRLQEAILVGNYQNQIKFSELTLDMYRMLQALEREPIQPSSTTSTTLGSNTNGTLGGNTNGTLGGNGGGEDTLNSNNNKRSNPHKYLLYRPTFAQLYLYIATCFKDLSDHSALLIYLSADGAKKAFRSDSSSLELGFGGGIATAVNQSRKTETNDSTALVHSLHPLDLVPFTRKPLFLIVDSTNSESFKNIPRVFSFNFVCLMSPLEYPSTVKDMTQIGSLFSLFLYSPVKAFAYVSEATEMAADTWTQCIARVQSIESSLFQIMEKSETLDGTLKRFMRDDFLAQFLTRFMFCKTLLHKHVGFTEPHHFPMMYPPLPADMEFGVSEILGSLQELVSLVNVAKFYHF